MPNILIVDDKPENLRLLLNILQEQGHKVRPATSGDVALTAAKLEKPDLILLDIRMPHMDGYMVCQALKADSRTNDIPVIFISSLNEVFDKVKAFSIGGVDYITKPFEVEEVVARVQTHLMIRNLQSDLQIANETLENKVKVRTAELVELNGQLQQEIEQRVLHQREKDQLFTAVSQQSEQLRSMTNWLLESQKQTDGNTVDLHQEIERDIHLIQNNLAVIETILPTDDSPIMANHWQSLNRLTQNIDETLKKAKNNLDQSNHQKQGLQENPLIALTTREREVLQLLVQGKTGTEIAAILTVSISTVYTYTSRVKQKLDIHDVPGLVRFVMEHKLLG